MIFFSLMNLQEKKTFSCTPLKLSKDRMGADLTFQECGLSWIRMNFAKRLCGMLTDVVQVCEAGGKGVAGLSGQIHLGNTGLNKV